MSVKLMFLSVPVVPFLEAGLQDVVHADVATGRCELKLPHRLILK